MLCQANVTFMPPPEQPQHPALMQYDMYAWPLRLCVQVWVVFIGGAASLFILTVLVENNGAWFPAISRANQAMKNTKKQVEQVGLGVQHGMMGGWVGGQRIAVAPAQLLNREQYSSLTTSYATSLHDTASNGTQLHVFLDHGRPF
jgi:hypothetical protein